MKTKTSHNPRQIGLVRAEIIVEEEFPIMAGKGSIGELIDNWMRERGPDNEGHIKKITVMLGGPEEDY